jgi:hypothetical protein
MGSKMKMMHHAAYEKLAEAEHFLRLMKADWSSPGFQHNLSAFLSALFSCTEHNRLFCKDARFPAWYQQTKTTYFSQPDLAHLRDIRNKETHHKGTESWQDIFVPFPQPLGPGGVREISWTIDLSSPAEIQEVDAKVDGQPTTIQIEKHYVFDTPASDDIMSLCDKGIAVIREILNDHRRMCFEN